MDEKKLNNIASSMDKGFWSFWDSLIYKALESSVDIMPPRLQKIIANYYIKIVGHSCLASLLFKKFTTQIFLYSGNSR